MTKKLTSIQTLIQDMETLKKTKLYQGSFKAIDDCIALAYAQLDDEKNQLIKACKKGSSTLCCGETYFEQTYK
jgi:hypothetical protein